MLSSQDETIMHIDRVTSDERSRNDMADTLRSTQIPDLDGHIPAARNDQVRVFAHELGTEDTIVMTGKTTVATFESLSQLACLFVINTNLAIFSAG